MRLVQALRRVPAATETADPVVGDKFGGGYYVGKYQLGGLLYWLIAADSASLAILTFGNEASSIALSESDGALNTIELTSSSTSHPAAQYCSDYVDSEGNSDYYLASNNEKELCYRSAKPTTTVNVTNTGANSSSVPPTSNYTATDPRQTTAENFLGSQSFDVSGAYLTSTRVNATTSYRKFFTNGTLATTGGTTSYRVRPVRKVLIPGQ